MLRLIECHQAIIILAWGLFTVIFHHALLFRLFFNLFAYLRHQWRAFFYVESHSASVCNGLLPLLLDHGVDLL